MFDGVLLQDGSASWITVGPFLDYQDGVTPVTNLSGSLSPYVTKAGSFAAQLNDTTPAQAYDRDGRYRIMLAQADKDTQGLFKLWVQNSGVHLDVEHNFIVLHSNSYLSFVSGQDSLQVDVTKLAGDSSAATNLMNMYDGTGYTNANAPATQAQATGLSGVAPAALRDINLDHLMAVAVTGTDVVDDTVIAALVSSSATADWDDFDNTTDSLQAIRDRGDAAWTTGGGGSITVGDILAQAQLAIVNSGVLNTSVPSNWSSFSIDGNGRVDVGSWLGTAVTTSGGLPNTNVAGWLQTAPSVGATSGYPVVDAQAISDNTAAADNVQSNIGNLDAAISSLNDLSAAEVNAEVDTAIETYGLQYLVSSAVAGANVTDDSIIAQLVSSSATADWDTFDNTTESLQAIRDRGDGFWVTGGGGSLTTEDVLAQAQLAIANSGVLNTSVPSNWSSLSIDGSGRVDVSAWQGTTVTVSGGLPNTNVAGWRAVSPTVGSTSNLPVVDSQAISDSTSAADSVQSNIGNLDATVSSRSTITTAQVNTEVDTALSDYDPPTRAELTSDIATVTTAIDALPTAAENAAALLDLTDGVETGVTPRQALRAMAAVLAGESSGVSSGSPDYKAINNNGTTRVSGTASSGDRSSVTLNL